MAKKNKKKPKRNAHPTMFVFDGGIRYFENGSMLELYSQVTMEEWSIIAEETIKYQIFLECLKEVAVPLLEDEWNKEDDWFRLQLDVAVSRIRNIDPLLVAGFNREQIKNVYADTMRQTAPEVLKCMEQVRESHRAALLKKYGDTSTVSDL